MARRRDFVRGAAAIRQRRLTTWFQFSPADSTMTASGGSAIFSLNAAALALRPFTIVRSHFEIGLRSDQEAAVEQQRVGFGIAVVSDEATAVGVTAIPTPVTEAASNLWLLHQYIFGEESRLVDKALPERQVSIDSKAMRKVEVGQDVVVVAELAGVGGGVIITVAGRMLIKNN